ncbi:PEP-CTERM sorting domain-containing protein [Roseateles paludis]|jgi:hypothetical protein|uniref:PEP-CTERM sorting domain-containing protein n=1 Tax=Roseateles paludis TaxID=3145238 RepID=A0ABV0FVV4_9BURK
MNKIRSLALATTAILLGSATAHAAPSYQFTLTGGYTASWQLSATPTPGDFFSGESFTVWNVSGTFSGASTAVTDLTFFNDARGGGLSLYDFNAAVSLLSTDGPQLYSGSEAAPTFLLGTFVLTVYQETTQYSLTISEIGAVPEPGAMALLLCGLLAVGVVRRLQASQPS